MKKVTIKINIEDQNGKSINRSCTVTKKDKELKNFVQVLEMKYKKQFPESKVNLSISPAKN